MLSPLLGISKVLTTGGAVAADSADVAGGCDV